jgi:hypothetical protein
MTHEHTLKPCPFCGAEPKIAKLANGGIYVHCANVKCPVLPSGFVGRDVGEVVAAWNTRRGENGGGVQ